MLKLTYYLPFFFFFFWIAVCTDGSKVMMDKIADTLAHIKAVVYQTTLRVIVLFTMHSQ